MKRRIWILIAAPLLAPLVAVLVVLKYPAIVFNGSTLAWAAKKFGPADYAIQWSRIQADAHSEGFLKDSFSLRFEDLCVDEKSAKALHVCFARVGLSFKTDLKDWRPRVSVLGPIEITGGEARADLDRMPRVSKDGGSGPAFSIPVFLREAALRSLEFDLGHFEVLSSGVGVKGSIGFRGDIQKDGAVVAALRSEGQVSESGAPQSFRVFMDLRNPRGLTLASGWLLDGTVDADLPASPEPPVQMSAKLTAEPEANQSKPLGARFKVDARYRQGSKRAEATIEGHADPEALQLTLSGRGTRLSQYVDEVSVTHCELNVKPGRSSVYGLACPVSASVPIPPKNLSAFGIPAHLGFFLGGEVSSSTLIPSAESQLEGHLALKVDPVLAPLFTGGGDVETQISGKLSELFHRRVIEAETHFYAKIPKFEKVVEKLSGTEWDVPAPLRALQGSFELDASGKTDLRTGVFPSRISTKLVSLDQALQLNATSTFELKPAPQRAGGSVLDAKVVLADVQVELPRLDLAVPPRFMPDDRIRKFVKRGSERISSRKNPATLAYQVEVNTPPGHPLKIISNLAAAPVPVDVAIEIGNDGKISGPIKINQFPVVLFRQKAVIDHFTLVFKDPRDASSIDGLIKIPHGDYTILIYVVGTFSTPRVRFDSDPPVPANQLLSVLLYGESQDSLDANQSSSVGSSQAAMSAGAMGLASLYLFASTPIQSVLYDPTTGQVSARVSLGGGTTLNLGSNGSQLSTVGLRKRLGPSWSITTAVDPSKENTGAQVVTSFLEWIHRY
jgi:hypothetical protein